MTDIIYPSGCRPLTEDLGTDELVRRLKTLTHALQSMKQDDNSYQQYIPLSLQLVDEFFLQHPSRDVQLLVACCIADVLRVYAPEAPYKDQEQIRTIFMFFIRQLDGLRDPKDPAFTRYFYLLENLAFVKSFNMCFDIEDSQKVFAQLFSTVFKIINDEHSFKVKNFFLDIICPLVTEADNFTMKLLDLILINIVEPHKSQNANACQLAEQIIIKTGDSLEAVIKMFFNQTLIMDNPDRSLAISHQIYDLIYELNQISPNILCSVLPQLECKLKSTNEEERLKAVTLLARMFSEPNSELAKRHHNLYRQFLGRFCDISINIRIKCVQSSMHFLLNHPHLRKDITDCLRARQHDSDEFVRYEVVMAIVETAKRQFKVVCESEDLLIFVRERTLDKKFKIRKEAMSGLAFIYKQAICEPNDLSDNIKKSVYWIKNKILHGYYMAGLEDRLLVERLLITCLVPYKLASEERMKKLYHLLGTLDENATKAFIELQKNQMKTRKSLADWIKLHHTKEMTPKVANQLSVKQTAIAKLLPDPLKAGEYLTKFSQNLRKDSSMLRCMDIILKRDVSCKECADTMSSLLKKLGNPAMTNLYYNTVKMLIERVASVMVDKESIELLVGLIESCIQGSDEIIDELGISHEEAGERGLKILSMLSYIFSAHFFTDPTLSHMVALLSYPEPYVAPLVLKSFTQLGRVNSLRIAYPAILEDLAPICKDFALMGSVKQAKHAVRCTFVNSQSNASTKSDAVFATNAPYVHPIFREIMEILRTSLVPNCEHQRTKIVTLGHIAYNMPQQFSTAIKNMIARRIVKELLIQGIPETRDCELPEGDWCTEEELPPDTVCKLDALKTMALWLLGLRSDEHSAQKTFRMLNAFIKQRGDLLEQNRLCPAEKSWLRLGAACAMLKVCEQRGVGDQYNTEQFFNLSQLMCDPVAQVRDIFVRKLHKGLSKGLPNRCLPLDFMGFYALAGTEHNKKFLDTVRHFLESDINKRREYIKTVSLTNSESQAEMQMILPDYMLAFAIPVLVHDPSFTDFQDRSQLKRVEKCLRFILDPLMMKRELFSYSFYKNLIEMMKNHQDSAASCENDALNYKLWAACDLTIHIINSKIGLVDGPSKPTFAVDINLPQMFFKPHPNINFYNKKIFIPLDMYTLTSMPSFKNAHSRNHQAATEERAIVAPLTTTTEITLNCENSSRNLEENIFDNIKDNSTEPPAKRTRAELIEH